MIYLLCIIYYAVHCGSARLTVHVTWPSLLLLSRPFAVINDDVWSHGGGVITRLNFS